PAGLYDRPFWRRNDPEPTRGRPPDELALGPDDLMVPPEFLMAAALEAFADETTLDRLLTAMLQMVREGRTLSVSDEPERLGGRIGVLTFAVPEPLRAALTFSTYH